MKMELDRRKFLGAGGAAIAVAMGWPANSLLGAEPSGPIDAIDYLDPELRPAARQLMAAGNLSLSDEALTAMRQQGAAGEPLLPEVAVEERQVPGGPGMPAVTVFVVNGGRPGARPGILHTHGGGHVLGAARSELRYLQALARELDCIVVTVEYRRAPETRYIGSTEDNYAALRWMHGAAS
jgi:acetyl esterase/lipase